MSLTKNMEMVFNCNVPNQGYETWTKLNNNTKSLENNFYFIVCTYGQNI